MIERVHVVGYGRSASVALAGVLAHVKTAGPLAPATVIVPSNLAGLTARRVLASGLVGDGAADDNGAGGDGGDGGAADDDGRRAARRGIVGVNFFTPFRFAQLLSAECVGETSPLTNPVLGAAVRRSLADDPGPFAAVADHHATQAALASLYGELSNVTPDALAAMAAGGRRAMTALAVHRAIARQLDGFHDEAAIANAARTRPDLARALVRYGRVVWYLPEPATAPIAAFVGAVLASAPSSVIVGLTGDDHADAAVRETCRRAGVAVVGSVGTAAGSAPFDARPDAQLAHADRIVSVTDADEEVRAVVRAVVTLVADGVALDRVGIFYPVAEPYVTLLPEHLAAAGIAANGPRRGRLGDSVAARTLVAALELPRQRWRRDRVMALVNGGPIRNGDAPAHPSTWEQLSRLAGIVGDLGDWRRKLAARRQRVERARAELEPVDVLRAERASHELVDIDDLGAFVEALARAVDEVESASSWPAKAAAATALLHRLLGPAHQHASWPEGEQRSFERVEDALARLGTLEVIEPRPPHAVFVRALVAELDVTHGRNGRFGHGVLYGPLAAAVGHDLDAVFVLGCTEGLCPAPRRDDSLLPDAVRRLAAADGRSELPMRAERLHDQHRTFLAALESAPAGQRVLTFPRGDLRSSRVSLPSRWLLDTASALAGRRVHTTDFDNLHAPFVDHVASHAAGIADARLHGSLDERDLAVVAQHVARGGDAVAHPDTAPAARGIAAQIARRSDAFTEWDGNLAGHPITVGVEPQSPTRLEAWATCGLRYFFAYVLGVADRDDPERIVELDALGRGSAVHEVLEAFFAAAIAQGAPVPGERWSAGQRAELRAIAEQVFAEYERRGLTGRPVHWEMTRNDLLALLDNFLTLDDGFRAAAGAQPVHVELPFGLDGVDPVTLTLLDDRVLSFRGRADRVDRSRDGTVLVSDYKTGKSTRYRGIDQGDPVSGGTMLQLGLYAEAALARFGAARAAAHYWLVNGDGPDGGRYGYAWTPDRRARLVEVLSAIVDGIEAGVFAAVPGEWSIYRRTHEACAHCAYDSVCVTDRGEHAEAMATAVELRRREPLAWEPA